MNWNTNNSIRKLQSIIDSNIDEHNYRLARYYNDITVDLLNITEIDTTGWAYRFFNVQDSDLLQSPKINVIKSVIDTLTSKLANQKVRPYYTPVNGLYSTRKAVKQAQQFFDIYFDKQKVQDKVVLAYRNSCIFGIGYIYYNPFSKDIEVPGTWQVAISNTEKSYGKPTKCLIEYRNFPITQLSRFGVELKDYSGEYVNFKTFIDTLEKKIYLLVNDRTVKKEVYEAGVLPIIPVYNTIPVFGTKTVSIVDELDGIQTNIDLINQKISAASQLTPGNTTYISAGSNLNADDVNNRTGNIYTVKMIGQGSLPVVNVTPAPFDPMWLNLIDKYVQQAYETIGVSQLSAQSRKPSGLESGVALQTMADIESDRFQTQLTGFVNAFVDIANMIIEVSDGDILPKSIETKSVKWKDIRRQKDLFKVQYSAMSILSKDPQNKLQQILQLSQVGLITTDKLAKYLDSPDLEDVYSGASSATDAIDHCIEDAIENEVYEFPDFVGYQKLLTEIIIMENKLYAAEDEESLKRLSKLKEKLLEVMNEEGFVDLSNAGPEEALSNDTMTANGASNQDLAAMEAQAESNPIEDNTTDNPANLSETTLKQGDINATQINPTEVE